MMGLANRSLFTPTQWQELEHQALIYKYMVSGVPIPAELIYSVKRSLDSSLASRLFPHQNIGWGCFQVGFGRKADPEPGRCRRTDGKKWRCSKEAHPDSKYCERHMHRGRNRSRKPVEVTSTATPTTTTAASFSTTSTTSTRSTVLSPSISSFNRDLSMSTSSTLPPLSPLPSYSLAPELYSHIHHPNQASHMNPFLSHPSSSSRPPGLSLHNDISDQPILESGYPISCADKDYRYIRATREAADERSFFPEASGGASGMPDSYHPLAMSSYKSYSHPQHQTFIDVSKGQQQQEQHCFVLGTDIRTSRPVKLEKEDETHKPVHQFFGDWTPKNTDSWLDLASNSRIETDS